ncbi:TetR family transcriptional regulator [Catellatospora methionotrophica]|uniref:TetR family transcriptional regulator n=1 Tax=Catellatospora methionotrophica TaxID=121620 RepID=A0A8J3LBT5_9ACTN|nr:TetR/AcrR family transcriptional regulator [Catellatospora methionotrophica]GIG18038.1 TetR family transcriptional regulator [Catellatospora methionotrophica]
MIAGASAQELLERVVTHAAAEGITGRSLRDIAAGVGTSHRMLLYHFGSREGLLAAVVGLIEQQQRDLLAELADRVAASGTPAEGTKAGELMLLLWARLSDPELRPYVRLFFEVVGVAVHDAPGTGGFLANLTGPWLDESEAVVRRLGLVVDRDALRLGVATCRGLLLELLAGADPQETDASYRLFVDMWEARLAAQGFETFRDEG